MRTLLLPLLLLAACDRDPYARVPGGGGASNGDGSDGGDSVAPDSGADLEYVPSSRADLRLMRWRQLLMNLEGGLALTEAQVCREAGLYDCADLHVVPLGGVSINNGLYRPIDAVGATTSMAMERVVLQACWNRLGLDRELLAAGGSPVVFGAIDLATPSSTAGTRVDVGVELYRRLLARHSLPVETQALEELYGRIEERGAGALDWAVLACFAVGTTTEALTY